MWHYGNDIRNFSYSEYIPSLSEKSNELLKESVCKKFKKF